MRTNRTLATISALGIVAPLLALTPDPAAARGGFGGFGGGGFRGGGMAVGGFHGGAIGRPGWGGGVGVVRPGWGGGWRGGGWGWPVAAGVALGVAATAPWGYFGGYGYPGYYVGYGYPGYYGYADGYYGSLGRCGYGGCSYTY
jgi:hypothetical protein